MKLSVRQYICMHLSQNVANVEITLVLLRHNLGATPSIIFKRRPN